MCKKLSPFVIVLIVLAFLSLPVFIILKNSLQVLHYAFFFYLIYAIGLYAFYRNKLRKTDLLRLKREELQEKMNSHEREILRLTDLNGSLEKKTRNYQRLEKFTEDLNNETFLDSICDIVVSETFGSFGAKGNVLLYLLNEKTHKLELRAIKKEIDTLKIQEKMGDLFDQWALRHNKPLLVEDAMSDFRFNPDRIKTELSRPVGSLICVPLVTETSSLGILRIDSAIFGAYQSDDLRFLNVIADIAKLSIENAVYFRHMQELSITDGLTGIFLRRYALERLKEEFIRAQRAADPLSFLMVDIDHFKRFNDSFGHMGGDIVLKKVAKFLKDFFDLPGSIVARYGGEEFCVILPHARKEEAMRLAESYRLMLSEHEMTLRKERVSVTVSIGVAAFPEDAPHYEDLVRCSDDALFKAKRSGRNKVCSI